MHALIVDDDEATLNALQAGLVRSGFRVLRAGSGDQALEIFLTLIAEGKKLELLVTDLKMPGISGLELIRRIKIVSPELPCILITAFGGLQIEKKIGEFPCTGYLEKPFNHKSLMKVVSGFLNGRSEYLNFEEET